jgi:DNA-binding SARP family transcriptional activator
MRQILKEDQLDEQEWTIRFENGYYFWNPSLAYELDTETFEKSLTTANCDHPDELMCCLQAIDLYRGDYLPDLYEQHWVFGIRNHYRRLFLNALHDAVEQLYEQKNFSKILSLCQQAIQIDNYEERFHIEYMKALAGMGRLREALAHYDQITSFYYKELGLKPSDELKAFYKTMTQTEASDPNSDFIQSLTSRVVYEDAYYCEPETFRAICELEKRRHERDQKHFMIGVLKLVPIPTNSMSREQFRVRHLKLHLLSHLRKGDSFTLWNQYQFLILLENGTEEGIKTMLNRMVSTYEQPQHLSIEVQ